MKTNKTVNVQKAGGGRNLSCGLKKLGPCALFAIALIALSGLVFVVANDSANAGKAVNSFANPAIDAGAAVDADLDAADNTAIDFDCMSDVPESSVLEFEYYEDGTAKVIEFDGSCADMVVPGTVIKDGKEYRVTAIGANAFDWTQLKSIVISEGIVTIGERAFQACESLESVVLPTSLRVIEDYAFICCKHLKSVVIPEGVTTLGIGVFRFCDNLESVVLPEGLKTIGKWAFGDCRKMKSISIPHSVESIGKSILQNVKLESVELNGNPYFVMRGWSLMSTLDYRHIVIC